MCCITREEAIIITADSPVSLWTSDIHKPVDKTILGYILRYMTTTILFKTDKKLKEQTARTAKKMGLPVSTVLNELMRGFVKRQAITFKTFEEVEDEIWLEKILKAEKNSKYLGPKESKAFLEKIRRNAQSAS